MKKTRKNLGSLLRKTAIISAAMIPLVFAGCKKKNYPPTAELKVSPTYGNAPLEVRMKLTGNDLNGIDDIKTYKLNINQEIIKSSSPIDITRTFKTPGVVKVYGEVVDYEGESGNTNVNSVEVYRGPFIEQSASLSDSIKIKYSATLSKVNEADLTIKKDGKLFLTEKIKDVNPSGADFEKTFNNSVDGITKGKYKFILKTDSLEKENSVEVPNYKPKINLNDVKANFQEGGDTTIVLPVPTDKNPEDNPVAIQSAKSLDNKTKLTLNGYKLKIESIADSTGSYQVELKFGSEKGGLETAILSGNIIKHIWKYLVDPFSSTNENGAVYDLLTTRAQRDSLVQADLNKDWVSDMKYNADPLWDCTEEAAQLTTNFYGFPGLTGYSGDDLDSIYAHHGTLKDNGKYGLPVYFVGISISDGTGHDMNGILTGDDATEFKDWDFIEPQTDSINVKPGHLYMPKNCEIVINYAYILENEIQGKFVNSTPIWKFKIENGVANLIWENTDPNLKIINHRK